MGIHNLWESVEKHQYTSTLSQLAHQFFERHNRWPVVAIDIFPFLFEISSGAQTSGQSNFHRQFIRRIRAFLQAGIIPIGVFDGQEKLDKIRHEFGKRPQPQVTKVTTFMVQVLRSMGLQVCRAPAEGEAQCTKIQQLGMADYVFSIDSDCLVFGASKLIFFDKAGDSATKSLSSRAIRVTELPPVADSIARDLDHWRLVLRAVLQGNDFSKGVDGIGDLAARACASRDDIVNAFAYWYHQGPGDPGDEFYDLVYDELTNNRTGIQQKKWKTKQLNRSQIDHRIVKAFISPKTSRPFLALASTNNKCWKEPNYATLLKLWQGESPIRVPPKAQQVPPAARNVQRDTIQCILTELWCLYRIMCNNFDPSFAQPLGRAPNNTKLRVVKLSYSALRGRCSTVEEDMEIKLAVHLTQEFKAKPLKPKPKPRPSKMELASKNNHTISFAKLERHLPSPESSERHEDPEDSERTIIDLTSSPSDIVPTNCQSSPAKLRTVSVTNYFAKRLAPDAKTSSAKRIRH